VQLLMLLMVMTMMTSIKDTYRSYCNVHVVTRFTKGFIEYYKRNKQFQCRYFNADYFRRNPCEERAVPLVLCNEPHLYATPGIEKDTPQVNNKV
jgi:hypothetical protein